MNGIAISLLLNFIANLVFWSLQPSLNKFAKSNPRVMQNIRRLVAFISVAWLLITVGYYFGQASLVEQQDDHALEPETITTSTTPINYKKTESGPDRASFSNDNPPTKPTLNTVHDYPDWGDEQDFVGVSDGTRKLRNAISVSNGERYRVVTFIRNDGVGSDSTALNTRLKIHVPDKINAGSEPITAVLTSDNTAHKQVWDSVTFSNLSNGPIHLKVEVETAEFIVNNKKREDFTTSDIFNSEGTGALIGCTAQDGKVFGDDSCAIRFEFEVTVFHVGVSIETSSKPKGSDYAFNHNVQARPGDTLTVLMDFHNPYKTNLNNTEVHFSTLPEWARPVSNSMVARRYTISEDRRNYANWGKVESDFAKSNFFMLYSFEQNQGIQIKLDIKIADDALSQSEPINLVVCDFKANKNTQFDSDIPIKIKLLL